MPNMNKLSIYMIKDDYASSDKLIIDDQAEILTSIENVGVAYFRPSAFYEPKWLKSFFGNVLSVNDVFTANARVALIIRIPIVEDGKNVFKAFAVTMGYGKYLFKENVIEERFGLRVVLNTIKPDSLRRINKTSIGGNQKISNEQLPLKADIGEFGFDIDRDLIGFVTGVSDDEAYVKGIMTGGDMLNLTADVDISNIKEFIKKTYDKYQLKTYRTNFAWVDHIQKVKDSRLLDILNTELINQINNKSPNIWMAVPDIINWEDISGFKYSNQGIQSDIEIGLVCHSFRNGLIKADQLKSKRIIAVDAMDDETIYKSWQAYNCLYGELEVNGKAYCINNGKWYCVDNDFVAQINGDYLNTNISPIKFIDFSSKHSNENEYSKDFVSTDPNTYLCMDKKNIAHGGGHSKIELCDILMANNSFIHVKPYSGSSTLSHLFNQAVVSAELVLSDLEFYNKANTEIGKASADKQFLLNKDNKITITFGIISKGPEDRPEIPFFSKVAFKYIKRRLETFGCDIYIKNIKSTA